MSGVFVFKQPPQGFHTEYFGGGGGKGGTTVQSTQIPPEVLARYNAVNARAEKVAETPFQRYGGEFVAPINAQQTAGINAVNTASTQAQPYFNAATGLTMSGAQDVGPLTQQQIGYYQNPFTQSVVDPTVKAMQQQFGQQNAQQQAQAIKGGAFGTERAGLQRAALQGQQGLAQAQAIAPIYERGYATAADLAKSQQGVVASDLARRMQAGQQIAGLGTAAQAAGLQGAQARIAAGTLQQQTSQAGNTALYQQHLQEQGYPFQVAQFLANIAEGTGALSGNTTTQNRSGGFFSNRGGFKVNERAARAYGGGLDVNSMGGAVYEPGEYARGGYEAGGDVQMADILASQQAMFQGLGAPYGQGQKPGTGLGIPSQAAKITPLQVKPIQEPQRGQNPFTTAANAVKDYKTLQQFGSEVKKDWFDKKDPDKQTGTVDATKGGVLSDSKGNVTVQGQAVPVGTNNGQTPTGPVYGGPKVEGAPASGEKLSFGPEIKDMGVGSGFDASNTNQVADLGGVSDMGGEQVADLGSNLGDFGSWFGNRGGAVPDYACGGLVPRQAASTGKFVTPGYDPELPGTDIMDTTVEEGEQSVGQLKNEQESMNPKISNSGGGGGGILGALGTAASIGKLFLLKDGGRANGYAEGGADRRGDSDPMAGLDLDRLQALLAAGSKGSNTAPIRYQTDDGTEFRGQTTRSGPFSEYGVGLGTNLGGGRLDFDIARGSAPHSAAQYRGGLKWSKNFADGGLVYREHHAGTEGNVVGERPQYTEDQIRQYATTAAPFLIARESAGDPAARATTSSAAGLGQFTDSTAREVARRHPEIFQGVEYDPNKKGFTATLPENVQRAMIDAHAMDQARLLIKHGIEPTPQNIHMNWFLGEAGGPNFMKRMKEDPSAPAHTLADRLAVLKNQNIFFNKQTGDPRTAQEVYDIMGKGSNAPRPPMDIGRAIKNEEVKGTYGGNAAKTASLGDVVREYAPSGVPTSENFWIPALGFLGGMLTSPNRSLAGAIGSGLVSGASGYMELRKGQQEDIKNAFVNFKDQFEDALDPKTGLPAKKNKYTGEFVAPNEVQDALAKRLRAIGVDPAAYGVTESKSPAVAKTTAGSSGPLPPPVTGEKAGEKPAEKAETPEAIIQYAAKLGFDIPQKPPADMPKTEMSPAQLEANVFWNWKSEGLAQDPLTYLKRIDEYRKKADAWSSMGSEKAQTEAKRFNDMAESQSKALREMLEKATRTDAARNLKISESQVERANKHVDAGVQRTEKLDQAISDIDQLAYLQNAGLASGYGSDAMNRMQSLYQRLTGEKMPLTGQNPNDYEYAVKIAAARVASSIKEIGGQRAPGVTSALEGKIAPDPEKLTPGAIHKLLGQAKADALYNLERDRDFALNHRYDDPGKHVYTYRDKPDDAGYTKQDKYNRKLAEAYSSLPLPTREAYLSEIIKELNDQYGKYGYKPNQMGARDVSAPAAPTVAPGQKIGDRKQFKQGWGVWNGSQWVPEGQQ